MIEPYFYISLQDVLKMSSRYF